MPFADFDDFDDCVSQNSDKNDPDAYCGAIKHQVEDKMAWKQVSEGLGKIQAALTREPTSTELIKELRAISKELQPEDLVEELADPDVEKVTPSGRPSPQQRGMVWHPQHHRWVKPEHISGPLGPGKMREGQAVLESLTTLAKSHQCK